MQKGKARTQEVRNEVRRDTPGHEQNAGFQSQAEEKNMQKMMCFTSNCVDVHVCAKTIT